MRKLFLLLFSILIMLTVMLLTGCGEQEVSEPVSTAPPINAVATVLSGSTSSSTAQIEEPEDPAPLAPDVPVNMGEDTVLSKVTINNIEVDITDISLADILETTGISHCPYGSTHINSSYFTFVSRMFGVKENDEFAGTMVSIEVVDENGSLVSGDLIDSADFSKLKVKGIYCGDFWTKEDFDVKFGDIRIGDKIPETMGDGYKLRDGFTEYTIYNNGKQCLMIELDDNVVADVYLVNCQ